MEYKTNLALLVYNADRTNHLRGTFEITLPFVPTVGMHIQINDMYPVVIKRVVWLTDDKCFDCTVEDESQYEFKMDDDVSELTQVLDILRDAKKYGWKGLDKIYRDV